jgi:hypothetical protein
MYNVPMIGEVSTGRELEEEERSDYHQVCIHGNYLGGLRIPKYLLPVFTHRT